MSKLGVIVIGKNEAQNLPRCLESVSYSRYPTIYVDSYSTDKSIEIAKAKNVLVCALDDTKTLSAARARNIGFQQLLNQNPSLEYIQFVDGDCELIEGWLESALKHLETYSEITAVRGKLNEKFRNFSVYTQLAQIEWDTAPGEISSTGGLFMCRTHDFRNVNGFNSELAAGEEPEFCYRLRQTGARIECLDTNMAVHNSNFGTFSVWWKRTIRSGYAYSQGYFLHKNDGNAYYLKDILRIILWTLLAPVIVLTGLIFDQAMLLLLLIYPLKVFQLFLRYRNSLGNTLALIYGTSLIVAKFAQLIGVIKFCFSR